MVLLPVVMIIGRTRVVLLQLAVAVKTYLALTTQQLVVDRLMLLSAIALLLLGVVY